MKRRRICAALGLALSTSAYTDDQISLSQAVLAANASYTWEYGTEMEALLELDCAQMSVFGNYPLPPTALVVPTGVIDIISPIVIAEPATQGQIIIDGAAGDPASLGVAVLIANVTLGSNSGVNWLGSATRQLDQLLYMTPRAPDGAISHRTEQVQLWSDFVYMAPPFIAYYGALASNQSLLQIAYEQCGLYRANLKTGSGCWQHIALGYNLSDDAGLWATGNAWAAAGMMRVYMTIAHSAFSDGMSPQLSDLAGWINEIQSCAWSYLQSGAALFHNYLNDSSTFLDAASTSLMAATTFRYASLGLGSQYVAEAQSAYQALANTVNTTNGIVSPVVDPLNYPNQLVQNFSLSTNASNTSAIGISPEAQAFVLLLQAAYRDYQAGNVTQNAQPSQLPVTTSTILPASTSTTTSTTRSSAYSMDASLPKALVCVLLAILVGGCSIL